MLTATKGFASLTLAAGFTTFDWVVVGAYLLVLIIASIYFSRKELSGSDEYFLGGRRMPVWAVACSVLASTLSVATFVGVPELTYSDKGSLTYLVTNIGGIIAILLVAFVFIPAFYQANVTTVYELLERRFGVSAKRAASAAFMVGRVFASGARVYIAAIPLAMILFGVEKANEPSYLIGAIVVLSLAGVLCTLIGGIASVIYTDVIQTIVLLGAAIAGLFLLYSRIEMPLPEIITTLTSPMIVDPGGTALVAGESKLRLLDFSFDFSKPFTFLAAVTGFTLISLGAYGTDHDMAQRMLTCKNAVAGGRSAILAIFMGIPVVLLFLCIGLLLFVFYKVPLAAGATAPANVPASANVFMTFVLTQFPSGLSGLMVAGLFAVGLGSLNSAINAMAATYIKDFYIPANPGRGEKHYLSMSRWAVTGWGTILALFAIACIYWVKATPEIRLLDFALGVMTFAYSGLVAVFLCLLFTRRGNGTSAKAALLVGFGLVTVLQPVVWQGATLVLPGVLVPAGLPSAELLPALRAKFWFLNLAFPWHMVLATSAAFAVCVSGSPRQEEQAKPAHAV